MSFQEIGDFTVWEFHSTHQSGSTSSPSHNRPLANIPRRLSQLSHKSATNSSKLPALPHQSQYVMHSKLPALPHQSQYVMHSNLYNFRYAGFIYIYRRLGTLGRISCPSLLLYSPSLSTPTLPRPLFPESLTL